MYQKFIKKIAKIFNFDAHYFVSNSFWVAGNQGVSLLGSLLVTLLFAHYLSEELFGNYRYLVALASIISIFSLNSIGQSILQTVAQKKIGFFPQAMRWSLLSGIGSFMVGIGVGVYYYTQGNTLLASGCFIIALTQPFISTYFNIFSLLSGQRKFRELTFFQSMRVVVITLTNVTTIIFTKSIIFLFLSYQISQLLTSYLGYVYFRPKNKPEPLSPKETKKYLVFATHQSIQSFFLTLAQRLDAIIIFQYLGGTQLAIYTIALVVPEQIRGFVKNISTLLFPKYVNYTKEQLYQSIPLRSFQLFIVLLLISIFYILFAPILLKTLFPKYVSAVAYSQVLALAIPASVYFIIQNALKSETNNYALYQTQLSAAFIRIVLILGLTYFFGIQGTVYAFVISAYAEMSLYFFVYFKKKIVLK